MVVLLEGSPISTEELCQNHHRVLGHLPDQGPSPTIAQFGWAASSRKVLVVPNSFHLRIMEATVFLGTFNAAECFWYRSPDLCLDTIQSRSSTDNSFDVMAWFLLWPALLTVRHVPFHIMSNQLNLPQVDSNQVVEMSQGWSMETGCTWAQFWVSLAKGLKTHVNKIFLFLIFNNFAKMYKNQFSLHYYGVLCVDWWGFC